MEEIVANIRSTLISTKGSTSLQELQRDYKDLIGEPIPFRQYGYNSIETFLQSVPTLKLSKLPNGLTIVDAVATENVKHIAALVNKQKTKKKVGYVTNKFKQTRTPYMNKQSYYNRPSRFVKSPVKKEQHFVRPRPVGNRRRLSVFDRLGPRPESSEDLSTFDEDEDFISKFQTTRTITSIQRRKLPADIKISSPNDKRKSSSEENWDDASFVLKEEEKVEQISKQISRLSLLRERISQKAENDRRMTLPAFGTDFPPNMVFNNNVPVTNLNISDFDRPRMRLEHNFATPSSVCGATRPRFFAPNSTNNLRPTQNIPRYNQINNRMPWKEQKVVEHRLTENKENFDEKKFLSSKHEKRILTKIPKYSDIPNKGFLDVKISHINDPHNFFIQPLKSTPILNTLMGKIQLRYCQNSFKKVDVILNNYYCHKHKDGFFYRVQVTRFVSPDHVHVLFIDFGKEEEVSIEDLLLLEEDFCQTPVQTIKAKLIGVKPKKDLWSKRSCDVFREMAEDKVFVSVVTSVDNVSEPIVTLRLFDTSGDDDVNIGDHLVEYGVADHDV